MRIAYSTIFETISIDALKAAIESKSVILLDCCGTDSYKEKHLPAALNTGISYWESKLPGDGKSLVVAYAKDDKCNDWKQGADVARSLGYANVKRFALGLKGWVDAGCNVEAG